MSNEHNKAIYSTHHDKIIEKRFRAGSPIRRHAHHAQYQVFVDLIPPGSTVIDSGCGEGVLSVLLAKHGCIVTGIDLSQPNIEACKKYAEEEGVSDRVTFMVGDAEHLPVVDKSFDYSVSSHVLEHVPDFQQGARELGRVARIQAIAAIPTCMNMCSWVLLGGDKYWTLSRKSPYAIFVGFFRVVIAYITGQEGVNEGYAGRDDLIHIYRFPRAGKKRMSDAGLRVVKYRASGIPFPYLPFLVPISTFLERFAFAPVIRNWGYGTTYVCEPELKKM